MQGLRYQSEGVGVTFSDSDSALVPKFLNPDPPSEFFRIYTAATIDATDIRRFYISTDIYTDHADSYYCLKYKETPDTGPVFHKFLTPAGIRVR